MVSLESSVIQVQPQSHKAFHDHGLRVLTYRFIHFNVFSFYFEELVAHALKEDFANTVE